MLYTKLLSITGIVEAIATSWHSQPQPGLDGEPNDIEVRILDEEFLSCNDRGYDIYFEMTKDNLVVRKRENCFDYADVDLLIDFNLQVCKSSVVVTKISKTNEKRNTF